ncbi:MAG: D-alanyl-D-alanine carboxypeptidase [Thermoanaerobaculia bacterium]
MIGLSAAGRWDAPAADVLHRSNELRTTLKRFLAYSNNDIERVADPLGGAAGLERFLRSRLEGPLGEVALETTSGLGINRMSPATVVAVLRTLNARLAEDGLSPGDMLPMPGCDPGSLEHALPHWQEPPRAGAMACKTGTLIHDDGGVAALAGFLYGRDGTALYMVAAPRSGARIEAARGAIESWVDGIAARLSGPSARECGAPVEPAEFDARVVVLPRLAQRTARSAITGR